MIFCQILSTNNSLMISVWKSVGRIWIWILGLKWLMSSFRGSQCNMATSFQWLTTCKTASPLFGHLWKCFKVTEFLLVTHFSRYTFLKVFLLVFALFSRSIMCKKKKYICTFPLHVSILVICQKQMNPFVSQNSESTGADWIVVPCYSCSGCSCTLLITSWLAFWKCALFY